MQLNFDAIEDWHDSLTQALDPIVPSSIRSAVAQHSAEYLEDSTNHLFSLAHRLAVINAVIDWLKANQVIAYHGTRLTDPEIMSVKANGLLPLNGASRADRLRKALSQHSNWPSVSLKLDSEIKNHTNGQCRGDREGQVHLTLSRSGLVNDFNHYLKAGSEFDQCVAEALLGEGGIDLLGAYGKPTLITVSLPGSDAFKGANHWLTVEDMIQRGDTPNMVREFLRAWAYRLYNPSYSTSDSRLDCGLIFLTPIDAECIIDLHTMSECETGGQFVYTPSVTCAATVIS